MEPGGLIWTYSYNIMFTYTSSIRRILHGIRAKFLVDRRAIFSEIWRRSLVKVKRRFGKICRLHLRSCCSSETSVDFHRTTRRYNHFCGDLSSPLFFIYSQLYLENVVLSYQEIYRTCTFFFFFYSCCSHLEHRASVKRVWLQFLNLRQSVGLLERGSSSSQGRFLTQNTNKHRHPCLERDSNPRSKYSRGLRHFMS
jgi:hypothetical protein